jgi:hypothetical protein
VSTTTCPRCAKQLDDASAADGSDDMPGPGDVSLCLYCGHLSVFTGQGIERREVTNTERSELLAQPEVRQVMVGIFRLSRGQRAPCGCVFRERANVFVMEPCSETCSLYCFTHTEARRLGKPIEVVYL